MTTTLCNSTVLQASNFIDPKGGLVSSAALLADAVNAQLAQSDFVVVDLDGLRSVSSSYFNTLLSKVAENWGADAIQGRISFRFSSSAQRVIYDRSYRAVLNRLGV